MGWLQSIGAAMLGTARGRAAVSAAASEAAAAADPPTVVQPAAAAPSSSAPASRAPEHLVMMVHGLFGTRDNWTAISALLAEHLDPSATLLVVSHCNEREKTFDGIDTCGERLAAEIRRVAAAHPGLQRISILGHSMGGLISRYAVGRLYDPGAGTVAGLRPCHMVCMATPHLGCDAAATPAQVPLIGWSAAVPAVGAVVQSVMSELAAPVTSLALGRVGLQFFLQDGGTPGPTPSPAASSGSPAASSGSPAAVPGSSREPLIVRLSRDCPEEGLPFLSALAAFETRTLYANSSGDHLVGWANASLRRLAELPAKNGRGAGVVREDPLEAAWWPEQRPSLHATPAAQQLHSGEAHRVSREALMQAHSAGELAAASTPAEPSNGGGGGGTRAETAGAAAAAGGGGGQQGGAGGPAGAVQAATAAAAAEEERLEGMLRRLQALPWRRVDVCFGATPLPMLSHQHIQMQRWWVNWPGRETIKHLALQLASMEELRAEREQMRRAAADTSAPLPQGPPPPG